jgi:hypothetical protein
MIFTFDTETRLIMPADTAPDLVCLSWCIDEYGYGLYHQSDPKLYDDLVALMEDPEIIFVGQYIAYDWGVLAAKWPELLPTIFELYDADRVTDTSIRQKLIDIARGQYRGYTNSLTGKAVKISYHLADLAKRHLGKELDKDTWRLRYGELIDTPLEEWPQGAKQYPIDDAISTHGVFLKQEEYANLLDDQYRQARAEWALRLMSAWGIRTDPRMTARLRKATEDDLDACRDILLHEGLLVQKKDRTYQKKVKLAQERMKQVHPCGEKTPTGKPKLDETNVKASQDDVLIAFQKFGSSSTIIKRVEELEAGHEFPIHSRFEVLMETGRTSSSKPNIQNRSTTPGDRECIIPRSG